MADFRRGDLVELPDGERWTVETSPGNAGDPVSLCRTGSAGPPLAEASSAPAGRLRLVQPWDLRSLGKGTDIDHIIRQDRRRQPGGWLGEILRPVRTVTPAGEAQIQRAAEAAYYVEQWREQGGQSRAWARWAARRAAQEEVLRVTAESDPDVQVALRAPRAARAGIDSRPVPAAAHETVAPFARHAVQVLRAWRETDADFLNSHHAELEAANPGRFEAESAGPWDREAALSAVAAALTLSDPDVRAAAEERREAHEFNRSLHASVGAEFGGIPDLDPNIGSLAARHASERVEEADQAYDDAYYRAFDSYHAQVERTWDIDGSFPAVAADGEVSPDAASWSPPAPETKTQPPEMTGTKTRASASSPDPVPHPAPEATQAQPSAETPTTEAGLSAGGADRRPKPQPPPQAHVLSTPAQPLADRRQKEPNPMTEHPARGIAAGVADACAQLEDLLAPVPRDRVVAGPWPGDLTVNDHAALLPHLRDALTRLGVCVEAIAAEPQYQERQRDSLRLAGHLLARGADQLGAVQRDPPGPAPSDGAHPAQVTANGSAKSRGAGGPRSHAVLDFPASVTPGKPARAAASPRATGQASRPSPRRAL